MMSNPAADREFVGLRRATLDRRRFIRGLGACLTLPAFESLRVSARCAEAVRAAGALARGATGAPVRLAFVYFPNGAIQNSWWPKGLDKEFELAATMEPLAKVKHQLQILGGMDHVNATPGPDGPGDHARASGSFLTGVRVRKTAGSDIRAGISIDQVVAQQVGHLTRFPSLELSCDAVRKSGNCDSGYSCAYQYNLAWRSESTPVSPEPNPRLVFERLFGAGSRGERSANLKARQAQQRSILDFVLEDADSLARKLNERDKDKLDEYLTSVREVEQRIERAEAFGEPPNPDVDSPEGIPPSFPEYIQLMFRLMELAFATDSTRVATFLLANEGSNRAFPEIEIPEGHHYLTHHQGRKEMIEKVAKIDHFYVSQLGQFLDRMEAYKEADGRSLLDNSMIVYGSGNADGNRHTHTNLPVILAGGGGGKLQPGRHVKHKAQPMSNMLLGLAARMGVTDVDKLGDSTGRLDEI